MVCRMMLPVGLLLVLPVVSHGWEEAVSDGLVLHLDARTRADAADRPSWRNLVDRSDAAASRLHNFTFDDTNGWVGTGSPTDPFALRFDGQRNYVEGMCDLETSPITLEVWACVEGMANAPERGNNCRGATLIGNDFGMGGVSLMVHAPTASPLLLHGKTFSAFRTDAPLWRWHQFALTLADGEARLFVDGDFQVRIPAPRDVQEDHRPAFLLGAARQPSNDFVEADGLIGRIAIVRVYRRALAAGEIRRNFETDRARFAIASPAAAEPVRARPGRCEKWDYYYYPPRIGGTGGTGWPSNARQAFDGYPTDISQPYRRNYWRSELKADQPAEVTIAYPKPVEVTQYVHYFIEPAGWKQVDVLTSADGETWEPLQGFAGLPPENPQVLRIDRPRDARFYRIVVRSLHGGAQEVMAHEIETYYGVGEGGPHIETRPRPTAARPAATPQPTSSKATAPLATCEWSAADEGLSLRFLAADGGIVDGVLSVLVNDHPAPLTPIGGQEDRPLFAATVPNGALTMAFGPALASGDLQLECHVTPDDPAASTMSAFALRLAVKEPKVMFRPHIDWYTAEQGPNVPDMTNGHNSATRMLCVQTAAGAAISMAPDTDNMTWGFTKDNAMKIAFQVPLRPVERWGAGGPEWQPIWKGPSQFKIALPVLKGDWWDAYRHVVTKIFHFEQARPWAMPMTQMQMLATRSIMRHEYWSERWQTVRAHAGMDFFYNFYGFTYSVPALYGWWLATDDTTAKLKAEKEIEFLLNVQEKSGPLAGGWFSQYCVEGNPPRLIGRDQAFNRWLMPHAVGTTAWTLQWYWNASGRQDGRVFEAARRGCEWLLAHQRPDGGWPYGVDLEAKSVSDLTGAGQIWCTWALWRMYDYSGDVRYRNAALRSRDAFKKTFMNVHRYQGYWEDVSGAGGNVARSWEGYEPAIASLVFADMGDKDLAVEAAKDAAVWTWTRVTTTRQYETAYGQTTEQSLCGPSQAQSPMVGIGMQRVFELTDDPIWHAFAGATKAIHFAADPDQAYGLVATGGWDDPTTGVLGPPYENMRPAITANNSFGDEYGRQVWNHWCTDQFSWLALEWLVREANRRGPEHIRIDPQTFRGTVLGTPGRLKMPEERCDITPFEHLNIDWIGCCNDSNYVLFLMNHGEAVRVAVRPHEAHLDVYSREPKIEIGGNKQWRQVAATRDGIQYMVEIPAQASAMLVWDRIK